MRIKDVSSTSVQHRVPLLEKIDSSRYCEIWAIFSFSCLTNVWSLMGVISHVVTPDRWTEHGRLASSSFQYPLKASGGISSIITTFNTTRIGLTFTFNLSTTDRIDNLRNCCFNWNLLSLNSHMDDETKLLLFDNTFSDLVSDQCKTQTCME